MVATNRRIHAGVSWFYLPLSATAQYDTVLKEEKMEVEVFTREPADETTNIMVRWRFDGVTNSLFFLMLTIRPPISKSDQWSYCDRSLDGIVPTLRSQETQIQAFASDDLDLYTLACFSRSPFVFLRHSLRHYLHQDQGFKYIEGKNKNNTELIRFFHEWNKELFVAISLLSFVLVINMERKWTLLLN